MSEAALVYVVARCSLQDQYIFLHDAILEIVACRDTSIDSEQFKQGCPNLQQVDFVTKKTPLETQYITLAQVTPDPSNISSKTALMHPEKNRSTSYLPSQSVMRACMRLAKIIFLQWKRVSCFWVKQMDISTPL